MTLRLIACVLVPALVAACAAGPDYHRPETAVPAAFKEAWQAAAPADDAPRGAWWEAYADPLLSELASTADQANQNVQQAEAQYRAAQAAIGGSRAALFPQIGATAGTTRSSSGAATTTLPTVGGSSARTTDRVAASASWEVDLWGRLRRQLESSRSSAEASAGDLAAARLSAVATLLQSYVQLRALDAQRERQAVALTGYRRSLEITRNRYAAGVAPSTDVTQAESQLASTEAQDADLAAQRALLEHAIATLAGETPEQLTLAPLSRLPTLPAVPVVLPATLLERRPDVASAERRVAAANAQIGVARAAWFPALTISASGGYEGSAWSNLLSAPARFWSVGPALATTLFDGGARRAQNEAAVANYDAAVAGYRQAVLAALQEADDALATLRHLEGEEAATTRAAAAARDTLRVTENQYRAGTVSYLNVVIAQTTSLSADNNLISVQSRRLLAHIDLCKAMGGSPQP